MMKYMIIKLLTLTMILATVSSVHALSILKLPVIYFADGSAEILPPNNLILNDVASVLKNNEKNLKQVNIKGYADPKESVVSKQKLSEQRAQAVRDYLIKQGVPSKYLKVVGYADKHPLNLSKTEKEQEKNRRVELKYLTKNSDAEY